VPGTNLTRDEARERADVVATHSYDVDLDLTTGERTFLSRSMVRFAATPGASTYLDLVAPSVREVVLNGRGLDPATVFADSRIRLDDLAAENEVLVVADCAYMNTGEGLHRFVDPVDGEAYLYSQFEVADSRRVFAVFEQPDLKATFTFTVTAPGHWTVVSGAPALGEPTVIEGAVNAHGRADAGVAVWRFATTPRISSYITAIVAGPYHGEHRALTSSDGRTIPLGVYCRASLAEHLDTDAIVEVTTAGFAFYERTFGRPYPFAKYDQLFVPEFNAGAMENAGAVTLLESYVFRSKVPDATVERRAVTILHELAHMWFGDLVTMRWWDDLWLNESFAEFQSTRATAAVTRWTSAWTTFSSMEKSWAYRQDQLPTTHPIAADIRDLEDVEVNFDGITYAKGASVLRQLVAWVGEEEFDAGVRAYFDRHAWGNTRLRDLLAELEVTSGRDLSAWSALWLEQAGVTLLRPRIEVDDAGVITAFEVLQEVPDSNPVHRPHRLAVGGYDLVGGAMVRTWRVELDVDGPSTAVPELVGRPRPALILVNDDDLAYAKTRLDPASWQVATTHLAAFTQSLPRTLVWAAAWDATRDGETPARAYVDLVLRSIAHESDSSVVQTLLRQLTTALDLYVAPERRAQESAAAAERLLVLVQAAAAGSDTQLQLAKAFAARATTPGQLGAVADLLDGRRTLEGLAVDTDLRWELLTALVAGGRAGAADVAVELATDPTATGQRSAATARAAIPTAEAKATAWADLIDRDDLPNAVQAATTRGFARVADPALLLPFVEPYFAGLEHWWATRTNEIAQNLVLGLYPVELAGDARVDLLATTDTWLAGHPDAPPALRRIVTEHRDGVRRALAAQEADRAAD